MIISKTPLRVSLFSGGSDMPSFYKHETGAALSFTINKFVYVCVQKSPHLDIKFMYDQIEEITNLETMQHVITRETLKHFDISKEITIASISDILAKGSGLGASSAFSIGLINALYALESWTPSKQALAEVACHIEMDLCKYPVGKQDQYAAAFGGLNLFEFYDNEKVEVKSISLDLLAKKKLEKSLLLIYSGKGRIGNNILQKQKSAIAEKDKFNLVAKSRDKAYEALKCNLDELGNLLHESWLDKKATVQEISDSYFDKIYQTALDAGASGGKLLGAGGGGFFLFYVQPHLREAVITSITDKYELCKIYDFKMYDKGSEIIKF